MMKKALMTLLIMMIALPAFLQVMPHDVGHAFHQTNAHHAKASHGHASHNHNTHDEAHHAINLDIVTFYDEYLHVDLQAPEQIVLKALALDMPDIGFDVTVGTVLVPRHELASIQSRAPPDWQSFRPEHTPLYLSTQRLRI